ncbi:MAG: DegV family protein [Anaerolineaceae bacterium]|nr:DegV family protein [Anaerolineaceae bacterium]MBN2676895.1 DegV family protein [Anaerolineaceae bacterium]
MNKVAIITDSTVSIPDETLQELNINLVHQILIWGDQSYLDLIDIQPEAFYKRLSENKTNPTTSQATVPDFKQVYSRLIDEGYDVLNILLSHKLSGTIQSATQAREYFPGANIEIFDSLATSLAMGWQVLAAARAAKDGAGMKDCLAVAEKARANSGVVFVVDTLEFLHRGGRIGGAARFLGTALNLKPVLELVDGKIEAIERVPTQRKALNRMIEVVKERIADRTPVKIGILNANVPEKGHHLEAQCKQLFQPDEMIFSPVSPVIGTHAGPGTLGIAYMAGM